MKNLNELMNAFHRFMDKPRNPLQAQIELLEAMDKYGPEAQKEHDEVAQLELHCEDLERENAELRRRLRAIGHSDKVAS